MKLSLSCSTATSASDVVSVSERLPRTLTESLLAMLTLSSG